MKIDCWFFGDVDDSFYFDPDQFVFVGYNDGSSIEIGVKRI